MSSFSLLCVLSCLALAAGSDPRPDCHATAFIGTAFRDRDGREHAFKSEIGAFADGYATPSNGRLELTFNGVDDFGCGPWIDPPTDGWIALVRRGGCSIDTKIENAVRASARGLIVYNNRESLNLSKSRVTRKYQGLLSVVFTYKWKGEELFTLINSGIEVTIDLSIANPCIAISNPHEQHMQLVSISFACFIVLTISLAWLIFYYVQRNRDLAAKERKARGYSEADEKALKAIPVKTIKPNDKLIKDETECCAVCIDPYKAADVVRTLCCGHEFHKVCIDPWLLENRTCPMCKKDILQHYGSVFLGSQESIIQVVADDVRLAGPSSPEIQVVIVANTGDCRPSRVKTERVQPPAKDIFVASTSTLVTIDSGHGSLDYTVQLKEDEKESECREGTDGHDKCDDEGVENFGDGGSEDALQAESSSDELSKAPNQLESSCEDMSEELVQDRPSSEDACTDRLINKDSSDDSSKSQFQEEFPHEDMSKGLLQDDSSYEKISSGLSESESTSEEESQTTHKDS